VVNKKSQLTRGAVIRLGLWIVVIFSLGVFSSCSQTVESKPAMTEAGQPSPAVSGFFGNSYSLLQPGKQGQVAMVYINRDAQWNQYNKILLEPVEFWDSPDTTVSPADQHMLTAYFYNQLKTDLEKDFTIVDQGGPGVIVLQVALTNATSATPGLRSVSVVIP
jgi:hypothetical protein